MKTKLHEPTFALTVLGTTYVVSFSMMYLSGPGTGVAMVCAAIQVLIPYLVPFAWIGGVEARAKFFDPLWVKISLLFGTAVYVALSASWASSVLNVAFGVPASNFPIALALITIAYLPGKLLAPVVSFAMILLTLSASFIAIWAFVASTGWKQSLKRVGVLIAVTFYLGFVLGSTMFLQRHIVFLAQLVAVSTDFDSVNQCVNLPKNQGVRVVHVGNGNVLVYAAKSSSGLNMDKDFELRKCQSAAKI